MTPSFKLFLDCGHGGPGSGCSFEAFDEATYVYWLAHAVAKKIKDDGLPVVVGFSKESQDDNPSLYERAARARRFGADFTLSLHVNAGDPKEHGTLYFLRPNINISKRIGYSILGRLFRPGEYVDNGVVKPMRNHMHICNQASWTKRAWSVLYHHGFWPAGLLECEYASNPDARAWLMGEGIGKLVDAIVYGITTVSGGGPVT